MLPDLTPPAERSYHDGRPCARHLAQDRDGFRARVLGHVRHYSRPDDGAPGFCRLCGVKLEGAMHVLSAADPLPGEERKAWVISAEKAREAGLIGGELERHVDGLQAFQMPAKDGTTFPAFAFRLLYCPEAVDCYPSAEEVESGRVTTAAVLAEKREKAEREASERGRHRRSEPRRFGD